jgi:small-conductance mechanosensitive channel
MTTFQEFRRLLELWFNAALDQLQSPDFMLQLAILAGTALAALVLAPFALALIKRLLVSLLSRDWVVGICHVLDSVLIPGVWLLLLWVITESGRASALSVGVIEAWMSLLTAWVVIRLLSHVVRHRLWSKVIFFAVFTIAALDILGILARIEASLAGMSMAYGAIRISALNVVRALIFLAVLLWLTAILRGFLERRIVRTQSLSPALQALFIQLLKLAFPFFAVLAALPVLGVDLTALTIFGGALAVGIGLGLQRTVANLISGLSLIAGGSLSPGDVIAIKDTGGKSTYGRVTSVGARHVSLRTRNGTEHLVPNDEFFTRGLENWSLTDKKIRVKVPFQIGYEADPRQAIQLALEAADAVQRIHKTPKPVCLLKEMGESTFNMELRVWIDDPMNGITNIKSECLLGIYDRFKAAAIRFPVPQQEIFLHGAEEETEEEDTLPLPSAPRPRPTN